MSEARKQTAMGIGGVLLVLCCAIGPAVLGAVGGAATGSIVLGTIVAVGVATVAYLALKRIRGLAEDC